MKIYKFNKPQILPLLTKNNTIAIPANAECVIISDKIPEYYILHLVIPVYLNRFQVKLPRDKFRDLDPVRKVSSIYIRSKEPTGIPINGIEPVTPVTSEVVIPFRSIQIPELNMGEWYLIQGFLYPLIRFDSYDNGLYYASVHSKKDGRLIKMKIDENALRKYPIKPASMDDLEKVKKKEKK